MTGRESKLGWVVAKILVKSNIESTCWNSSWPIETIHMWNVRVFLFLKTMKIHAASVHGKKTIQMWKLWLQLYSKEYLEKIIFVHELMLHIFSCDIFENKCGYKFSWMVSFDHELSCNLCDYKCSHKFESLELYVITNRFQSSSIT